MKYCILIALALIVPAAPVAAKSDPLLLDPSSKWNVHVAEDYCRLSRSFGSDKQKITLMMDRFEPSDNFRLNLLGPPMKRFVSDGTAQLRFGRDLPNQSLYFYVGSFDNKVPAWTFAAAVRLRPLPDADDSDDADSGTIEQMRLAKADEAAVSEIAIGSPLRQQVILRTGPMKNAFAVLNACTEDLIAKWGLDIEQQRAAKRRPVPLSKPSRWVTSFDYPSDMIRKRQPGLVEFRLMIDATGKATACHIQQSTNPKGFNDVVCDVLMRRAAFEPALDEHGQPMASYYRNRVRFHM